MNKLKYIILLLLVMTATLPTHAQFYLVRLTRPGFPMLTGGVSMNALRTSLYTAAYNAGITARARLMQEAARADFVKSVFRALPEGRDDEYAYSGFIFKTAYQGKEEIFGVVAQHATPLHRENGWWKDGGHLKQSFTARVMKGDQLVDIPAQIVKSTSPTMPDIALVKFRPEDEKWLRPLTLATHEPTLDEPLQMIGFSNNELTFITGSPVLNKSQFSLRFPMGGDIWQWPRLCGSPVLNEAGEVVGTMTGAAAKDAYNYWGFATKSSYLRPLVAAYHNDLQNATFPLMLGEYKIVDLQIDEYVSAIQLEDNEGNSLFNEIVRHKFPYSLVMEHLPNARYVKLSINKVQWMEYGLEETPLSSARHVTYDLQEKKIVESGLGMKFISQCKYGPKDLY